MEKNKTGKYLKYAIGEIILVVIGILIALQVNNWNEQRKFNSLKNVYIERLIEDLKQDTTQINEVLGILVNKQQTIKDVIDKINTETDKQLLIPSIENYFKLGWNMDDFTASIITYSDLSQTGNMTVFGNAKLTESIQQYYVGVENNSKGQDINKDWIIPLDVAMAKQTSAFEFDPNTKELFENNDQNFAIKAFLDNKELFERNAAGHYWFNKSLFGSITKIKISAEELISKLQLELDE